ncbi:MAG: sigma-70 family RNA polymerase sigma factor [Bacteroidetes bacterium]|nr:sigma-70 family RNA polymerase sigma factor [Bacteroidota bacterium]
MLYKAEYNQLDDNELIRRYCEEDNTNYLGILFKRYSHLVLGLCIKYLKNEDEAQDLVMNIFEKLTADLKKHKIEFFKSWLYTYSKNMCLMELRKKQSQLKKDIELQDNKVLFMDSGSDLHLNSNDEKENTISQLETALSTLSKEQKQCIILFYYKNKSYNEIVDITGFNANEVKSYIQNGKRNLKNKITELQNGQ